MNISTKPYSQASQTITQILTDELALGPVLLLLSGGSATICYQDLASSLKLDITPGQLVIGLVDERYDLDPNHIDSNNKLICASGLISRLEQLGAIYSPILHGLPMADEVAQYQYQLTQFTEHEHRRVITILGVGTDGHIAGILPDDDFNSFKNRFDDDTLATGYSNNGPHPQRITVTFPLLRLCSQAIVLIKDPSKLPLIKRATNRNYPEPLNLLPATIIQEIPSTIILVPEEENL